MKAGDPRLPENFWSKVSVDRDGCWLWTAAKKADGYGVFAVNRKAHRAHRIAFAALVGPIPDGKQLDHLCRERSCVNPAHLEPVTQRANIMRGVSISAERAKQTHCIHGHPFDEENTRWVRQAHYVLRRCKACERQRKREESARKARKR